MVGKKNVGRMSAGNTHYSKTSRRDSRTGLPESAVLLIGVVKEGSVIGLLHFMPCRLCKEVR